MTQALPAATDPRLRLAGFAAYLREHGYAVGYDEVALMARVAARLPPRNWRGLEALWRGIAAGGREQWLRYPALHRAYWFPQAVRGATRSSGLTRRGRTLPELVEQLQAAGDSPPSTPSAPRRPPQGLAAGETDDAAGEPRGQGGASRTDALERRAFDDWQAGDARQLEAVVQAFQRRLRRRLLRRWQPREAEGTVHLRRSLRAALATGGELVLLRRARRRRRLPRVALLVDVSRSMETHAHFFLRVARVFVEIMRARVFVFHTRLAEVGTLMARRGERVRQKVDALALGFGGGTRIATCLRQALQGPLRRGLGRGDLFMVYSDGYDTDPPDELAAVLAGVRARGARVCWLHPTANPAASAALARAAGEIARFLPAHDLASLACLPDLLLPDPRAARAVLRTPPEVPPWDAC